MNEIDRDIEKSEEDAARQISHAQARPAETDRRASVASSASSSSSSQSSAESDMGRIATARDTEMTDAERVQTMLIRTRTAQSVYAHTVGASAKTASRHKEIPPMGGGKPFPKDLPSQDEYVVEYTGVDDLLHPLNWPSKQKYLISILLAFTSIFSTFGSSVFSPAVLHIAAEFHVSREVATLAISLYVLGFAFGPIIWAPLSELYGRRYPILASVFGFAIFQIAVATAKDLQTIMICRFFGGCFASAPLSLVGAAYADIWDNSRRGYAITIFSLTVSVPALLAPVIGGFLVISELGWRWTEYITGICGFIMFGLNFIFLKETFAPVVLVSKARDLRRLTKNWGIHAKQEEIEVDFKELLEKNFSRPLKILFTEPIVWFISLYVAFIYGMLYLMLSAFPIVFALGYKMKGGVANLPFISLCIGQILGSIIVMLWEPVYIRRMKANKGIPIPENRLPPAMLGAIFFPIGLFWFAWAGNYPDKVHWIVPTLSGLFIGSGLVLIFLQCLNYIIDSYLMFAASAISANSFLRSIFGAVFPLFAVQLFDKLGVNWAGSLLAFVAVALVPMPFVFYKYGRRIRERSKLAPIFDPHQD